MGAGQSRGRGKCRRMARRRAGEVHAAFSRGLDGVTSPARVRAASAGRSATGVVAVVPGPGQVGGDPEGGAGLGGRPQRTDRPPLIGAPNTPWKSSRIPNALIEAFVRLPAAPYQTRSAPLRVSRGRTLQSGCGTSPLDWNDQPGPGLAGVPAPLARYQGPSVTGCAHHGEMEDSASTPSTSGGHGSEAAPETLRVASHRARSGDPAAGSGAGECARRATTTRSGHRGMRGAGSARGGREVRFRAGPAR